jgi:hypothetical protein
VPAPRSGHLAHRKRVRDNLAATFGPKLAGFVIDVIGLAAGEKLLRKGGSGIQKSDLLNKTGWNWPLAWEPGWK